MVGAGWNCDQPWLVPKHTGGAPAQPGVVPSGGKDRAEVWRAGGGLPGHAGEGAPRPRAAAVAFWTRRSTYDMVLCPQGGGDKLGTS